MSGGTVPEPIGSRRELFVDEHLIDAMKGAVLRLHEPAPREVVLCTDQPWEGNMCGFITVFRDGDRGRMYYMGWALDLKTSTGQGEKVSETHPLWVCYAESPDGLDWQRPTLNLIEHDGSTANNLLWPGAGPKQNGCHGFTPFRDPNPDAAPAARYKAIGAERYATKGDLYAMASPDGFHWSLLQDEPILRQGKDGKFDSQNLAFWDSVRGEYRIYVRQSGPAGRDIATATSSDFVNWTATELLQYPGAPGEQLYTNQVQPYYRAPHILLGFPSRYVQRTMTPAVEALPEAEHRRFRAGVCERYGAALTDGLFMSSRDGKTFKRWGEPFLRPGPQLQGNWTYSDNYQCCGMLETPSAMDGAPPELSVYATENKWRDGAMKIRRYSLRIDGFVSLHAPRAGAEITTKPVSFTGDTLSLNMSTSAAGGVNIELLDGDSRPIPGFTLTDSIEVIGDELDRTVQWTGDPDLASLAGQPVRLHILMQDADLYSFQFQQREG